MKQIAKMKKARGIKILNKQKSLNLLEAISRLGEKKCISL